MRDYEQIKNYIAVEKAEKLKELCFELASEGETLNKRLADINKKARYLLSGETLNFNEIFTILEQIEELSNPELIGGADKCI